MIPIYQKDTDYYINVRDLTKYLDTINNILDIPYSQYRGDYIPLQAVIDGCKIKSKANRLFEWKKERINCLSDYLQKFNNNIKNKNGYFCVNGN